MTSPARSTDGNVLIALSPNLFVLPWSTGFTAMKVGVAQANR